MKSEDEPRSTQKSSMNMYGTPAHTSLFAADQ
jgi:hypothetical protein